jgi:hypothetical protein
MENGKLLNEERYLKSKKKIVVVALVILVIGFLAGGILIAKGINKSKEVNSTYTEENKQSKINDLNSKINAEKTNLESKKAELEAKGIEYKIGTKYTDGEAYDLYIIAKVLDPSFSYCSFEEYENNILTKKYCSLKNELEEVERLDVDFEKDFNNFDSIPFYMFGGFIIIASCIIAGSIYIFAKRREIMAFTTQQVMPVAQEGIEKMAPTIGNAAGEIAKGISSGIKNGLNNEDEK